MTVPNGWKQIPLSEVCRVVEGQVDPRDPQYRDLPHINGEVIESGSGRLLNLRTAAEDGLISGKYLFEPGMVLYSKLRPYLRKVAIAPSRGLCSADMYPLMFDPERVDTKFAMFTLLAEPFTRYAVEESRRARMPKLNRAQLMAWEMPLPESLEIQRRIVTDLAGQLAAADSAIQTCHDRLAAAELLSAAYLAETFEGTEARSWDRRQIGEVAPVQTGFAFKSEWFVQEGGVRVLRNANIHQGFIEWSDSVAVRNDVSERFGAFALDVGDIVLTLDRPLVAGGLKVARIGVADKPALLNQRVARFQVDASAVDVEFLYAFLCCPRFSDAIRGHDQSLGVPHISPGQVERVELPLPSLMTQKRVVSALSRRLEGAKELVNFCREESAAIETLPQEYLRTTFGGAS